VYGLTNGGELNQQLGAMVTKEDRCIAFPNLLQHQVQPFELVDLQKPGYRKILVFFLVDPTFRILSTENVLPQQPEWLVFVLKRTLPFSRLPIEIIRNIVQYVCPVTLERARHYRDELMKERKFFVSTNNEAFFERPFSLCEH